jgi:hypothetical protein
MEMIYEFGKPFADKRKPIFTLDESGSPVPSGLLGVKRVTRGRVRWFRPANLDSRFESTDNVLRDVATVLAIYSRRHSRFQGQISSTDKVRNWEVVGTLAASSVYLRGTLLPLAFIVIDPINHFSSQFTWIVDYYVTPSVIVRFAQSYFFVPGYGGKVDETWGWGTLPARVMNRRYG